MPADFRKNFPYIPEFVKANAPALKPFLVTGHTNKPHLVVLPTVAHPNNCQVEDVTWGKITDTTIQFSGNAHVTRGENWLAAQLALSMGAMVVILANRDALTAHLPTIIMSRMLNKRPTQVLFGEDKGTRIKEEIEVLDAHLLT